MLLSVFGNSVCFIKTMLLLKFNLPLTPEEKKLYVTKNVREQFLM